MISLFIKIISFLAFVISLITCFFYCSFPILLKESLIILPNRKRIAFIVILYASATTLLLQSRLPWARDQSFWQTGHSLCTSQTKVSCNWTVPSSLVQNTWVSVQQETFQSKITKKAHHSLVKSFLDIFVLLLLLLWYLKSYSLSHIFIHISLNYLQL